MMTTGQFNDNREAVSIVLSLEVVRALEVVANRDEFASTRSAGSYSVRPMEGGLLYQRSHYLKRLRRHPVTYRITSASWRTAP
jgi:hypothetical protein